jgi:hypothetical protein
MERNKNQNAGNSVKAKATILLHELGHFLSLPDKEGNPFLHDNGDNAAETHNNQTVNDNCRQFIGALP